MYALFPPEELLEYSAVTDLRDEGPFSLRGLFRENFRAR